MQPWKIRGRAGVFVGLFVGLLVACSRTPDLYGYLERRIRDGAGDTCRVNLKEVYGIDFDRFYIVGESDNQETICELIGLPYGNRRPVADSECRLIFIKDNTVIDEIEVYGGDLYFDREDRYKELHEPVFNVLREGERCFYLKNNSVR